MSSGSRGSSWFDISILSGRKYGGLRTHGVVIDIGQRYTKAGFAGEAQPRSVFPTNFKLDGKAVEITSGMQPLTLKKWISVLVPFFRAIYYRVLQVNPADRPVIILENRFWPYVFKEAVVNVLFGKKSKLGAPSLLFLSGAAVPIYASGDENGLVVDIGYMETRVAPIAHGVPLQGAFKTASVGMKDVQQKFEAALGDANPDFMTLENMIIRTCIVKAAGSESNLSDGPYHYISPTGEQLTVVIPAAVRSNAAEALFGDNQPELHNIGSLVLDSLLLCELDQRPLVISNIILCGGTAHLPGFGNRLIQEMNLAMEKPKYSSLQGMRNKFKFFKSPYPYNILQWVGGAVVGSLDLSDSYLEKQEWEENGVVPDWSTNCYESEEPSSESDSGEGDSDEGDDCEGDEAYLSLGVGTF